ncbi:MAG: hypothetical protein KDA61_00485, partial [Planctomycetales bacterium]|nr:hypothetical protein [Planctomycetales bacterium]
HGGGAYGDKATALARFAENFARLSPQVQSRLTVENDDKTYAPRELVPLCEQLGIPLVYDVHHHRCLADGWTIEEATRNAIATWNREPMFHLSSPLNGWEGKTPERHHDFIDPADFPDCWRELDVTVEIEAKAKENAVLQLAKHLVREEKRRDKKRCVGGDSPKGGKRPRAKRPPAAASPNAKPRGSTQA